MAKEGNIFAYRVHSILLDVFSKLVCLSIEKKINDSHFVDLKQFLCQNGTLNASHLFSNVSEDQIDF